MRAIVCSDLHADWSTAGYERAADVEAAVNETVQAAIDRKATHWLFLGDLCDPDRTRAHRSIELAVRTAVRLHEAGIASRWLVGNHDVLEDGLGTSTLVALRALRDFEGTPVDCRVYDRPQVEQVEPGLAIVALPYVARSHAYDPEAFVYGVPCSGSRVVVLGHLNIQGIEPGSETSEMPRGREVFLPLDAIGETYRDRALVMNGHYHKQQVFKGIHIPGSLERLTFGELTYGPPAYLWVEA